MKGGKAGKTARSGSGRRSRPGGGVPTREVLLAFLAEARTALTPKEIAKAFGVRGDDRRILNALLKDLRLDGTVEAPGRKAVASRDAIPGGGVFEVVGIDNEGELLARATGRDGLYGPPLLITVPRHGAKGPPPPALGTGSRFVGKTRTANDGSHEVVVLKALGAVATKYYGVFHASGPGPGVGGIVVPADKKTKGEFVILPHHRRDADDGDLVAVRLLPGKGYSPKKAEIIEIIGHSDNPRAASMLAIAAHGIPVGFSDEELDEARSARLITALGKRTDLRARPLITIDPPDARDHDDAVHAEALSGGGFRITVAIADVAHYVTPRSALDAGALERGNSVYFPDRVVPMLPEELSADLCSLIEGADRPVLAVEIEIAADGTKKSHRFLRALMHSHASLSYEQAQAAIDGTPDEQTGPLLEPVLKPLWAAHAALMQARARREPLEITSTERKVELSEDGKVVSIKTRVQLEAHRLIEEMMIQANVAAAEELEKHRAPVIYRVHDTPSQTKLAALADFLATVDFKWAKGQPPTPARFNTVLAHAATTEHFAMINEMVLRTQMQAIYDTANIGHFGLHLARYAHFTSPIRRYADLVVHRALIGALGFGDDGLKAGSGGPDLAKVAEAISNTERRAMAAEREATDRYVAAFLSERVGVVFAARISSVTKFGLFVRLEETGADGLVPVTRLGQEYFVHDEVGQALIGTETGDRWTLGRVVEVRLMEATPVTGGLLFDMVSSALTGKPPGRNAGRRASRSTPAPRGGRPMGHSTSGKRGVTRRR
ncbi:MAG: ribonuclease R [Hyphomonadaceae bacterium]|jgi:ribonuclease R|nr:ribonuclease R [Hyphomonadaceae bacterium]